jgi:hypothetical protein
VVICAMIWGTTWYAITLQLGTVPTIASIVWRFGSASALLFLGCLIARQKLRLTRAQHLAALGQGAFAFSISYSFTYESEAHVASAIVAVTFASLTFINLVLFRLAAGQKAAAASWGGAVLGVVGVVVLSGGEVLSAGFDREAALGVGLALIATTASAFGNFFAWKGQNHPLHRLGHGLRLRSAGVLRPGHGGRVHHRPDLHLCRIAALSFGVRVGDRLRPVFHHRADDRLRHGQLCLSPDPADRHAGLGALRGRAFRLDSPGRPAARAVGAPKVET